MRQMIIMSTILIIVCIASVSFSKEEVWIQKCDMPTSRDGLATAIVDGKIYAFGGLAGQTLAVVEEYDPATDTWIERKSIPTSRDWASASSANGKIYVFGGWDTQKVVEEYDPITDKWTKKTKMPTGRFSLSTCTIGNRIYAIGGTTMGPGDIGVPTVEIYDPVSDSWEEGIHLPNPRWCFAAVTMGSKIYAIGGWRGFFLNLVEEFDTGYKEPKSINPKDKLSVTWGKIRSIQ